MDMLKSNRILKILLLLLLLNPISLWAQKSVVSSNGMVVSAHPLASEVGVKILEKGGNAIDAAVAVEFALAVVYPNAGNIGGGGFMVYRANDGTVASLDYRETAPAKAYRDMYLDGKGNFVPDKSTYGTLAAGVPGMVAGMAESHRKYGKLKWAELLEPAIELAEKGFFLTEKQVTDLNNNRESFLKYNSGGTPFTKDTEWKAGDVFKQPELANTLRLICDKGWDGFYRGKTADYIVSQMKQSGGIISYEDLKNYKVVWRKPIVETYKGNKVISMPPPSSGGIALVTLLKATEKYPLSSWGFQQDSTVQLMVEAQRRVYADRAEYLGDPDFYNVPQNQLLDSNYIKRRMADISFERATSSTNVKPILFARPESEQTTHYSIVDKDRNAVSATTTLNGSYGSKVVVKGAGFLLNNEMDDFSVKPGTPNLYGLVGGEANSIVPNKRMLSSMTPTILEKNGTLYMVVGAPGGSTIINSVFQTILNITQFGQDAQTAVSLPRFHHQWFPDDIQVEEGAISEKVREYLKTKGYKITPRTPFGRVEVIVVKDDNTLEGGADPRGDDRAVGY